MLLRRVQRRAHGAEGPENPVVFLSRKETRETRYSSFEKKCLTIKWSLEALWYYLLWRKFDLKMDH